MARGRWLGRARIRSRYTNGAALSEPVALELGARESMGSVRQMLTGCVIEEGYSHSEELLGAAGLLEKREAQQQ